MTNGNQSENSLALAAKLLDVVIRVQPKTEMAYVLYGKVLSVKTEDAYLKETIKKLQEVSYSLTRVKMSFR